MELIVLVDKIPSLEEILLQMRVIFFFQNWVYSTKNDTVSSWVYLSIQQENLSIYHLQGRLDLDARAVHSIYVGLTWEESMSWMSDNLSTFLDTLCLCDKARHVTCVMVIG